MLRFLALLVLIVLGTSGNPLSTGLLADPEEKTPVSSDWTRTMETARREAPPTIPHSISLFGSAAALVAMVIVGAWIAGMARRRKTVRITPPPQNLLWNHKRK
jgi:hypothetical protein